MVGDNGSGAVIDSSVFGMIVFALILVVICEINHRYQNSRKCLCAHRRDEHYLRFGRCDHIGHIGGLPFSCLCSSYRPAAKARV